MGSDRGRAVRTVLRPMDHDRLLRVVSGALKDAIESHGPITKDSVPSAAKRILGSVAGVVLQIADRPVEPRHQRIIERLERRLEKTRTGLAYWKERAQTAEAGPSSRSSPSVRGTIAPESEATLG